MFLLHSLDVPFMILQCTSSYPCPPESYGLDMIDYYRSRYNIPVGFQIILARLLLALVLLV